MKNFCITFVFVFASVCSFSQNKLIQAGQAATAGSAVSKAVTNSSTIKQVQSKTSSTKSVYSKPITKTTYSTTQSTTPSNPDRKYASSGYMEISGISFGGNDKDGHTIFDYGSTLYADELKYLSPRVYYRGLASESKEIMVYLKIIKPDGSLDNGTSSPEGYSYSTKMTVEPGYGHSYILAGWGTSNGGHYSPGTYKFQIWYNGNLLCQREVSFYAGKTPVVTNNILRIDKVSFGNEDETGKVITSSGRLYAEDMKYLFPKLNYYGYVSSTQKVTFFCRVFNPNGIMKSGTDSPNLYTYKSEVDIHSGTHTVSLSGYGNKAGTVYSEGDYPVEIWLNGSKVAEKIVHIYKKPKYTLTVNSQDSVVDSYISQKGSTRTYYVSTNADSWSTWGVPSWCSIVKRTSTYFTLEIEKNKTHKTRRDYMKVMIPGGPEVRINISQNY